MALYTVNFTITVLSYEDKDRLKNTEQQDKWLEGWRWPEERWASKAHDCMQCAIVL